MLSGLQKLTFSVSVIAHVIVFYPYATEIKQPSVQPKTLSFSLVRQVSQNVPPELSPDPVPDSVPVPKPDPVSQSEEFNEKQPELKQSEQLKQEKIVQNETKKNESVKKVPENSSKPANNTKPKAKPKTEPEHVAKKTEAVKNEILQAKSKSDDLIYDDQVAKKINTEPVNQQVRQDYLLELINKINANKYYPKKAKRRGWEGQVKLKFSILPTGEVRDIEILESSNYKQLDKSALRAIYDSQPFDPIPAHLGLTRLDLELPIVYQLN